MANSLRVTELDFDTIKENLKRFLNQQSQFTDYDFEGSGLNILIDLLAYNTHYNAYYLNMVANESFLDTALLRDSVVSHAKTLGYVPYSQRAPVAIINFTVQSATSNAGSMTIPAGFSFLSNQIDNTSYNFVVLEETTVSKANSQYYFENLNIYEGQLITYVFSQDQASNPKQIFSLPDANIDTTTIKVTSIPTAGNTQVTVYSKITDILNVTTTSEVFHLQENKSGKFQIYFGNDKVGKKLPDGAVVSITYLVTNGIAANKANNFVATATLVDSLGTAHNNFIITPTSAASGGALRETVDEIKFGAPAQFTTQNRLVTFKDYESYIKKNYPSVDSLSIWGGEDETPPVYGKVFMSLKPKENYYISETEKQRIINSIIQPKAVVSIGAQIINPQYLYLIIDNYVEYDKKKTTQTIEALKTSIRSAILLYNNTNLNKFDATFVLSKLQDVIDTVDLNAIRGSETKLRLEKRFTPTLNISKTYTIEFYAELHRGTTTNRLASSEFDVFDSLGVRRTAQLEEVPNSFTGITEINVTNAGYGYITAPTVKITGDGTGATATATIVNGRVQKITVVNRGVNYTSALITFSGGNGVGATAVAVIDSRFGDLRTIYYDSTAQRQTINAKAGTIDYNNGIITLSDLRLLSVKPTDGLIRISIQSEKGIISSIKNVIITIDETDPAAIVTKLVSV